MIYWRLTIETILPRSQRAPGCDVDEAIADQFPISDWMEMTDAHRIMQHLVKTAPIHKIGLLYGWQSKDDGKAKNYESDLVEMRRDGVAYFDLLIARKAKQLKDAETAAAAFIAKFPAAEYLLIHSAEILEEMARRG
jgi:hypothetical protein